MRKELNKSELKTVIGGIVIQDKYAVISQKIDGAKDEGYLGANTKIKAIRA